MSVIRVVIADDESPARRKIKRFLAGESDFEIVSEASTGLEAIEAIQNEKPDMVFLDVQMPGLDGFEVIAELNIQEFPLVVFTTAFDQFALRAFEVHALDYLLKPFDRNRFKVVLDRARQHLKLTRKDDLSEKVFRMLEEISERPRYTERLLVSSNDRSLLLAVDRIDRIEAARNYVNIHSGKQSYLLRGTIEGIYQKLDPSKFIRANRSEIVNIESIKELQPWFHGEYRIILKDGSEISWSRRYIDRNSNLFLKNI